MNRSEHYGNACLSVTDQIIATTEMDEDMATAVAVGFVGGLLQELRISAGGIDPLDEDFDDGFWRDSWDNSLSYEREHIKSELMK